MHQCVLEDKGLRLVIEQDENVGFYLLVYDVTSGKTIADYLQDSLDLAKRHAKTLYGVDDSCWISP